MHGELLTPQPLNSKGEEVKEVADLGEKTIEHIKSHVEYPLSKADIIAKCNNMEMHGTDYVEHDRNWLQENLPDRTYNNSEEVLSTVGKGGM